MQQQQQTAVIIGGSMAGLFTARVLANHFDKIYLLERDQLPTQAAHRNGVPQSRHVHVLLASGMATLTELFPGLQEALIARGATQFDLAQDAEIWLRGKWMKRFQSAVHGISCSRILLEATIRDRIRQLPKIEILERVEVTKLLATADQSTINGVQLNWRGGASGPAELAADFVVDASGRNSKTPLWLAELGYPQPKETVVNAYLGYATRRYKSLGVNPDWHMQFVFSNPPHNPRGGIIMAEEDGSWVVTLGGYARDYPPTDEAGFHQFMSQLPPEFAAALTSAVPDSPITGYQRTENRWRHYEKLKRMPAHFIVLGDAACCFNPIYGQGMTVSAMGAALLNQLLTTTPTLAAVSSQFPAALKPILDSAWLLSTGEDYRWPSTDGPTPSLATRFSHWYIDRLAEASYGNERMTVAFLKVQQMLKPAYTLFHPTIIWDLCNHMMRAK